MKAIIAGGRYFTPTRRDVLMLDAIARWFTITEVVSGGARGADAFGELWASKRHTPVKRFPADWSKHGNAAGPIRNEQMAQYAAPDGLCILFPGGHGTMSMRGKAMAHGLTVIDLADPIIA